MKDSVTRLPHNFLWGVATSSFQVEGSVQNDMTDWERTRAALHHYVPPVGVAVDHWNRWESDFELLRELGVNSYRFSIEWARIEPVRGEFDPAAIATYRRMIDRLRELSITPIVTLHHFSHPRWFHDQTPWHSEQSVESFERYVARIRTELLADVPYVVSFNEPLVWALAGYADARFPPGLRDLQQMMRALHHMLLAHRRAWDLLKEANPAQQVGLAHNFIIFKRSRANSITDQAVKRAIHEFYNLLVPTAFRTNRIRYFFPLLIAYDEPIELDDRIDFWGINYYYRMHVQFRLDLQRPFELHFVPRSGMGQSDLGWEIYPRGLSRICRWLAFTGKPLLITENGIATDNDRLRVSFLTSHLRVVEEIRASGAPLLGYLHWSLLDNYEWLIGREARFGLYHVESAEHLRRSMKASGQHYAEHVAGHP